MPLKLDTVALRSYPDFFEALREGKLGPLPKLRKKESDRVGWAEYMLQRGPYFLGEIMVGGELMSAERFDQEVMALAGAARDDIRTIIKKGSQPVSEYLKPQKLYWVEAREWLEQYQAMEISQKETPSPELAEKIAALKGEAEKKAAQYNCHLRKIAQYAGDSETHILANAGAKLRAFRLSGESPSSVFAAFVVAIEAEALVKLANAKPELAEKVKPAIDGAYEFVTDMIGPPAERLRPEKAVAPPPQKAIAPRPKKITAQQQEKATAQTVHDADVAEFIKMLGLEHLFKKPRPKRAVAQEPERTAAQESEKAAVQQREEVVAQEREKATAQLMYKANKAHQALLYAAEKSNHMTAKEMDYYADELGMLQTAVQAAVMRRYTEEARPFSYEPINALTWAAKKPGKGPQKGK